MLFMLMQASPAPNADLVPYMLFAALVIGAVLLILGFQAFRWKRSEAIGLPVEQVSHNDGNVDTGMTTDAMATQYERIGHIPHIGPISGQDTLDAPRPGPLSDPPRKSL